MLLAIDTSGSDCSVALYDCEANKPIADISETLGRGHAERLMSMLEELLAAAKLAWKDITRLAVVNGPGSFTGLRVGLATARGLAIALQIPCNPVTVFEAMEENFGSDEPLGVVIDAKRDQIWMQCFEMGEAITKPLAIAADRAAEKLLPSVRRLAGSAAVTVAEMNAEDLEVLTDTASPVAVAAARLAARQKPALEKPKPLYLRAPDVKLQVPLVRPV